MKLSRLPRSSRAWGVSEVAPERGRVAALHTYLTECLVSVMLKTQLVLPMRGGPRTRHYVDFVHSAAGYCPAHGPRPGRARGEEKDEKPCAVVGG